MEHADYLDVTVRSAKIEVILKDFAFIRLVRDFGGGTKVSTAQIMGRIRAAGNKTGNYTLKSMVVSDGSYARVTGSKPNLGLELLKAGNFTVDIVLGHLRYPDVTVKGAKFEVRLPGFSFSRSVRNTETISTDQILGQISDAKSKGYKLKSITVNNGTYARVTGSKPNLGLEFLKVGPFTVDIVLEHANYLDVTVRGAELVYVFDRVYGGSQYDVANSIAEDADGNLFVVGRRASSSYKYNMWILKLDKLGNEKWNKVHKGSGNSEARRIILSINRKSYVVGYTTPKGGRSSWIMQLGRSGDKIWEDTYGASGFLTMRHIAS